MSLKSRRRNPQSGFAISAEILLIGVILLVGLISGWAKFRDQSAAEIKDINNAIDAYIAGVAPIVQPYAQPWITASGGVGYVGCSPTAAPQPAVCVAPVTEIYDPTGTPFSGSSFTPTGPMEASYSSFNPNSEATVFP